MKHIWSTATPRKTPLSCLCSSYEVTKTNKNYDCCVCLSCILQSQAITWLKGKSALVLSAMPQRTCVIVPRCLSVGCLLDFTVHPETWRFWQWNSYFWTSLALPRVAEYLLSYSTSRAQCVQWLGRARLGPARAADQYVPWTSWSTNQSPSIYSAHLPLCHPVPNNTLLGETGGD